MQYTLLFFYCTQRNYFLLPEFECCPVTLSNVGSHLRILRHFQDDPKKGHLPGRPAWKCYLGF